MSAQHDVAAHYLGRAPDAADCHVLDVPNAPLQFSPGFDPHKKDCLVVSACHSIQLSHYFRMRQDFMRDYNVHIIQSQSVWAHKMLHPVPAILSRAFAEADVILSHSFLDAEFDGLNHQHHPGKSSRRVVIFPPPNSGVWWPMCDTYSGVELRRPAAAGKSREEVWQSLANGTFDCCFDERTAIQKAYAEKRELDAEIKIQPFVERAFRDCKLWWTENHPTFHLIAWIGSELMRLLGYQQDTDAQIAAYNTEATGQWNAFPETHYEWAHYGFRYPLRWPNLEGGLEYYHRLILKSDAWPKGTP